jgi:guanylate kinase
MNNKYKIIALFGKSSAGKDHLQRWIVDNYDVNKMISCTTRPPRDYEKEGIDYFFLTNEEFAEKVLDGTMLEATEFRSWFYGTPLESLSEEKINVGVFNPSGVACMLEDSRLEIYPIYVMASDKTRLMRSLNREENPDCAEICRRYFTDVEDFKDLDFDYVLYFNEDDSNLDKLREIINDFGQE